MYTFLFIFFKLHFFTFSIRCLHELRPHGGRPLSCLLFCDNHKRQDPELVYAGARADFTRCHVQIQHVPAAGAPLILFLLSSALLCSSQGSFLAVFDNRSRSEPGVEDVVHRFLDLFTDHQVIASVHHYRFKFYSRVVL